MSSLSPSRPRRSRLLSPLVLVPAGLVAAAALVGGALVLLGGDDDAPAPVAIPTACTVTPTPPTEPFTVDVYNATDRDGLAATTAEDLELRAFTIGEVANDPAGETVTGSATVRYTEGGADLARWVAAHVPKATITPAGPEAREHRHGDRIGRDGIVRDRVARRLREPGCGSERRAGSGPGVPGAR